jgi:large subunit ribosomal protein L4
MRRLAIRSLLSAKASDGKLRVIDGLAMDVPRTKDIKSLLSNLGLERSALVVTHEPDTLVKSSVRNLPKTEWLPAAYLNVGDLLAHQGLVMTEEAVRAAEALWGGERATKRRTGTAEASDD